MIDAPLCWLPYSFFSLPRTTLMPECSLVMKRQPIETILTLIWRHRCAPQRLFCFWQMTEDYLSSIMRTVSFDVYIFDLPSSFSFVRLCLCLSLFHPTALQHCESLALYALHLIFIWNMKASGMPSSQTPCEEPVESWLNICSVGRLDLTHSDIIAQKMQIFDTLPLAFLRLFSILLHYYSHSKGPYSKQHPIWAGVPTFILAEFNYSFPLLPFFFTLIHPKPWNRLYHFS